MWAICRPEAANYAEHYGDHRQVKNGPQAEYMEPTRGDISTIVGQSADHQRKMSRS